MPQLYVTSNHPGLEQVSGLWILTTNHPRGKAHDKENVLVVHQNSCTVTEKRKILVFNFIEELQFF